MKKIISLIICLIMATSIIPSGLLGLGANAEENANSFNIRYNAVTGRVEWDAQETGGSIEVLRCEYTVYFNKYNGEYNKTGVRPETPDETGYGEHDKYGYDNALYDSVVSTGLSSPGFNPLICATSKKNYTSWYRFHPDGEKTEGGFALSTPYNPTGLYKSEYGGTVSIRGWYKICVTMAYGDKFGNYTELQSAGDVWIDTSTETFPSPLCNVHVETIGGEQYLCWDPVKNGGQVTVFAYGTSSTNQKCSLCATVAKAGQTKVSLKETQKNAAENTAGWKEFGFLLCGYTADGELLTSIKEIEVSTSALYGSDEMYWTDGNEGFTVKWQEHSTKDTSFDLTRAQLRILKTDEHNHTFTVVYRKDLPLTNGVLSADSCDLTEEVLKNGDGIYRAYIYWYFADGEYVFLCDSTENRILHMNDYLYFTSQYPAQGETVKAEKGDKLNYSYDVAPLPKWMTDAGVTLFSDYAYLYVDGDSESEYNSTLSNSDGANKGLSWRGSANLNYIGTHTLTYRVRAKVGDSWYSINSALQGTTYVEVNAKPVVETTYGFVTQPGDITVKNLESPTISWQTNAAAPIVGIECYSDSKNEWMNVSSSLGKNASEGTYTIASRNNTYKHTRQKYRLYIKASTETGYKYTYGDVFTVTWTNDGKEPTKITMPSQTLTNGEMYHISVPFNYGSTGYGDNAYKTRYKVFLLDENGEKVSTAAANCSSNGSTLEVKISGDSKENSTRHFMLAVYNSSLSSDTNSKGIPSQNVYFDVTWQETVYSLYGTVTLEKEETDSLYVTVTKAGEDVVTYSVDVDGNSAEYIISGLSAGTYTVTVSKPGYIEQTETITITTESINRDYTLKCESVGKLGDINGDGEIKLADAMMAFKYVAKTGALKTDEFTRADCNKDGYVKLADAMAIFKYVAKVTNTVEF